MSGGWSCRKQTQEVILPQQQHKSALVLSSCARHMQASTKGIHHDQAGNCNSDIICLQEHPSHLAMPSSRGIYPHLALQPQQPTHLEPHLRHLAPIHLAKPPAPLGLVHPLRRALVPLARHPRSNPVGVWAPWLSSSSNQQVVPLVSPKAHLACSPLSQQVWAGLASSNPTKLASEPSTVSSLRTHLACSPLRAELALPTRGQLGLGVNPRSSPSQGFRLLGAHSSQEWDLGQPNLLLAWPQGQLPPALRWA